MTALARLRATRNGRHPLPLILSSGRSSRVEGWTSHRLATILRHGASRLLRTRGAGFRQLLRGVPAVRTATVALLLALAALPAAAVEPAEMLADPALEARAREISKGLRCVVCQNQSIDDSNAELAQAMRVLVRERLVAGDSDEAVVDYLVSRYGDFVLLKPRFQSTTLVLWLGPAVILTLAAAVAVAFYRRRTATTRQPPPPLSDEEQRRLRALLDDGSG